GPVSGDGADRTADESAAVGRTPRALIGYLLTGLRGFCVSRGAATRCRFDPVSHGDPGCAEGFAEARADSSHNSLQLLLSRQTIANLNCLLLARIREVGLTRLSSNFGRTDSSGRDKAKSGASTIEPASLAT